MANREHPIVSSSKREAIFVAVMWVVAATYTIGYTYQYGYDRTDLKFVFGFPDWVFWGIVTPWAICIAVSCWFAYFFMTDADLGESAEDDPGAGI